MAGQDTTLGAGGAGFPETTWGLVSRLQAGPTERADGLETLCQRYWRPVYLFLRRALRKSNDESKDITQAFFLWLLEGGEVLEKYSGEHSFRAYLKGVLRNFVRNHDQALARLKRGGGSRHIPIDLAAFDLADDREESPEDAFDRAFVEEILERATDLAREGLLAEGHERRWKIFEAYDLAPAGIQPTYASVAEQLDVKVTDVRNHLFAVRERIRTEARNALRDTVSNPDQLDEEWRSVFD